MSALISLSREAMRPKRLFDRRCSYLVVLDGAGGEPLRDHGATFGFRKSAVRAHDFAPAAGVFVRRLPTQLAQWVRERPRLADADFHFPLKSAFFFSLIPLALLLATFGGAPLVGGYA